MEMNWHGLSTYNLAETKQRVAVDRDLLSLLRGGFDWFSLSLAMISSSMVVSSVVSFHSDSGTFLLTRSSRLVGTLLIKTWHKGFHTFPPAHPMKQGF